MNDNGLARIFGLVFSGFMVKLYGVAIALYVAYTVVFSIVLPAFAQVNQAFAAIH